MSYLLLAIVICITIVISIALLKGQRLHKIIFATEIATIEADFFDENEKADDARNTTDLEEKK